MASVTIEVSVNNGILGAGVSSATNIVVSIPTPAGLEFDTIVEGSGYSDIDNTWRIASVAKNKAANITLPAARQDKGAISPCSSLPAPRRQYCLGGWY